MYLRYKDGRQIRVGAKSVFEIVTQNRETELRVRPKGGKTAYHISWHYGKVTAGKDLADIKAAIKRGDKVYLVDGV